jgi:heptosyltransferase II
VKILVRATNWIGDALLSLPALRAIRGRFPAAEIVVLARPWVAALYEHERSVDRIVSLPAAKGFADFQGKWKIARQLRKERFDLAVLLPNSFESAALLCFAGAHRIVGYARDGRTPLLTHAIPVPSRGEIPKHETYYYLELLRRADLIPALPEAGEIRFDRIEEARRRGRDLFARAELKTPIIGVSPGAAYGGAKRWLPERFSESARKLAAGLNAAVAVFGSADEAALCERVAAEAGGRNFAGRTTLREFIDMTAACRLFLTNDSGAMHIASALGVPSVAVFGPTDESATGPMGALSRILRQPVGCAPCLLRECPIDHRCMTGVSADRAVKTAEELLGLGIPSEVALGVDGPHGFFKSLAANDD